jgi:predicted nuclease of predicted toxin-antitoxin system
MSHILADENIHIDIVQALKTSGHIVVTVSELSLIGAEDETLLERANRKNMILLTADKDFGGILEMGPLWGKGKIILLRYRLINIDRIIRELTTVLTEIEKTFSKTPGLLVVLSEGRYRLHRPPLKRSA